MIASQIFILYPGILSHLKISIELLNLFVSLILETEKLSQGGQTSP